MKGRKKTAEVHFHLVSSVSVYSLLHWVLLLATRRYLTNAGRNIHRLSLRDLPACLLLTPEHRLPIRSTA